MSRSTLQLTISKCPHEVWHSHNSLLLDDGSTIPDPGCPDGCPGGTVLVGSRKLGISHALASYLRYLEEKLDADLVS